MKTAISLPDDVFRAVDAQAKRLKLSRSEFLARAAVRFLGELEAERIRASYDAAYAEADPTEASLQTRAARAVLRDVEWEDD